MLSHTKNIISIDVEDWYHSSLDLFKDSDIKHGARPDYSVISNTIKTLELLEKTQNHGTFFVLGTVAEHYPDLVKEILNKGHEVATHGYCHQLVYNMSQENFETDLKLSIEFLTNAGCNTIEGYRAPYWSITKSSLWALDSLKKMGLNYDSSIFPIRRGLYGIPDANPNVHRILKDLWEFPPTTIRLFGVNWPIAGGGYLRLVPYQIISSAIRKSSGQNIRVFYLHPYELDPTDINLKHKGKTVSTYVHWLQQRIGRKSNPCKLNRLLSDFKFTTINKTLSTLRQE